ncbi:MAG: hypothetical protein ACRDN9_04045 [Streptosporangiaceae bacterium]
MTTYDVAVTREDGLWVAVIDGLPPHTVGATDVERFADLDVEVRDLVAGLTDTDPDDFDLTWRYVVGGVEVTDTVTGWAAAERQLAEASSAREEFRAAVIDQLSRAGASQATIGDVLGLSHQRVHQLAKSA